MDGVIIKLGGGDGAYDPMDMANSVHLPDGVAKDAKDGQEVTATIKGVMVVHDGGRCISIHSIDGQPVEEMDMGMDNGDESGEGEPDSGMGMNAEDAVNNYFGKK